MAIAAFPPRQQRPGSSIAATVVVGVVLGIGLACADEPTPAESTTAGDDADQTTDTGSTSETGTETGGDTDCIPNDGTPMSSPDYGPCSDGCSSTCATAPGACGDVCEPTCPCPNYPGFNPTCVSFPEIGQVCRLLCDDDDGCPGGMFCSEGHCYWPG